ncbi:uncharacterized protein EI90DRAFT_478066 [Cantharellus anzutake]|uniref:uncharacterized protein n=1 Tax=Cantharellus anzutake TaxID=1750568 RepID=UPI0019044997|nr:uncharacterized protein EI90DRAFT_478066 [Cantharellus anzutake]KAF8314125.1 hypothetical protein EI90DRAFT_478066 [Cantharellus anzutake]
MVDGFEPGGRQHKYPRRLVRGSRKLSPNRGKLSISDVGSSKPTAPSRPPAGYPGPSSPLTPELDFNDPRSSLNTHVALDGSRSISARLERVEREGINLNIPPSSSGSDRKKTIIGATRLMLQTAAFVLKFSPIPKLDEIPNLLLTWLQVYETLDGNDTNLKELNGEFQKAYKTILQPLQMWTSQTSEIPPEVILLVEDFHSDLEEQIKQIQMLASRKITMRVVLGADIAREISNVKACIASALSRFATMATTLNLLNTIRASTSSRNSPKPMPSITV